MIIRFFFFFFGERLFLQMHHQWSVEFVSIQQLGPTYSTLWLHVLHVASKSSRDSHVEPFKYKM